MEKYPVEQLPQDSAYARIPAGVVLKKLNPKKQPAEAEAQDQRVGEEFEAGRARLEAVLAAATKDAQSLDLAIAQHGPKSAKGVDDLSARIWVKLIHCRRCAAGELVAEVVVGQGKEIRRTEVARLEVSRAVVAEFMKLPGLRRAA